jgi:hypothetical protein
MGKRSDFARRDADAYHTIDRRAVQALQPHLNGTRAFAEPCAGDGDLVRGLESIGLRCVYASDIESGADALQLDRMALREADAIITNPPWTRRLLHPLIMHLQSIRPTWLLFDSDWAQNRHAAPYLATCSDIVAVGRLLWIPGTTMTGKDNVSWYRFWHKHHGPTRFHGRRQAL